VREGQPRFSQDAIAEFEFLSSRFDATQGRSSSPYVEQILVSTLRPAHIVVLDKLARVPLSP
jgi:hypothetical protein